MASIRIGIMPREEFKKYTIDIAMGKVKPSRNQPKIWFDSIESLAQVLSTKNTELLRIIQKQKPENLTQLADATGRKVSNLSRTLKNMEQYGLVELKRSNKSIKPMVRCTAFELTIR
jgi:predicted transcriptional regulator